MMNNSLFNLVEHVQWAKCFSDFEMDVLEGSVFSCVGKQQLLGRVTFRWLLLLAMLFVSVQR
jgi:hypothetical protein